jgi:hypothetical protein
MLRLKDRDPILAVIIDNIVFDCGNGRLLVVLRD